MYLEVLLGSIPSQSRQKLKRGGQFKMEKLVFDAGKEIVGGKVFLFRWFL